VVLIPWLWLIKVRLVIDFPIHCCVLSLWLFLVVGIPIAKDVSVLNGYSFSYSWSYFSVILFAMAPIYMIVFVKRNNPRFRYPEIIDYRYGRSIFFISWVMVIIGCFLYFLSNGAPPLFKAASLIGDSSKIYDLRMASTYEGGYKYYSFIFVEAPIFLSVLGCCLYKLKLIGAFQCFVAFLFSLLLSALFLLKSEVAIIVASVFCVSVAFSEKKIRSISISIFSVLSALSATYFFYMGGTYGFFDILIKIFEGVVIPYIASLDYTVVNFPAKHDFFFGSTFPNPKGVFNFEPVYLSNFLMRNIAEVPIGTMPAPSIGFLFANFGYIGAAAFSSLMFINYLFLYWIYQSSKSILIFVVWLVLSLNIFRFNMQDPFSAIPLYFYVLALLFLLVIRCRRKV